MRSKFGTKNSLLITASIVLLVGIAVAVVFTSDSEPEENVVNVSDIKASDGITEQAIKKIPKEPGSVNAPSLEDEFLTQSLQEELDWVAQAYEQQSRYPANSRPVIDQDLARSPEPFEEAEVEMRLPDEDSGELSPVTLSASVDKMRYFMGDTISLRLLVSGMEPNQSLSASANIKEIAGGDLLPVNADLLGADGGQGLYLATVETNTLNLRPEPKELLARFMVQIDEKDYVTTVPFFLSSSSAQLENVALSQPDGAYLTIPLEFSVYQSGYYFVSAYLDDAASSKALLQLQTEGLMQTGNDQLLLKAHHQALKDAGSQGPYQLRVVRSYRGAEPGEDNDVPTGISQAAYSVPAVAFESYEDTPYSDPAVEERLQALRSLSGDNK